MISLLEIIRLENSNDCIRGVIRLNSDLIGCTLELPYLDNKVNISAIPTGLYKAELHQSPKFGNVIRLNNVPYRTDILIHTGNTTSDTQGCILVGQMFGRLQGKPAVLSSKEALKHLLEMLANEDDITVSVKEAFGEP